MKEVGCVVFPGYEVMQLEQLRKTDFGTVEILTLHYL